MKKLLSFILLFSLCSNLFSQHVTDIKSLPGEYWWGGAVSQGAKMPYMAPVPAYNMATRNDNNQVVPLLLSNKGRYVWSEYPFTFEVTDSGITIRSDMSK